jgi:nucleoside diphosphate kinase
MWLYEQVGIFITRWLIQYKHIVCVCAYSGPFEALVLGGYEAIARWRALIGPTHPIR